MGQQSEDFTDYVGRVIDAERVAQRLSVDELAALSGVPKRSLYRMLNADRDIKVGPLMLVAEALGMKASTVFAEAERRMSQVVTPIDELLSRDNVLSDRQKDEIRADVTQTDEPVTRMRHATGRDAV